MKYRYQVTNHYPVFDSAGKVLYTTIDKYRFRYKQFANIARFCLLIKNSILKFVTQENCYSVWRVSIIAKYSIDIDLGVEYLDIPPWRSYNLTACGDNIDQLLNDAMIAEIDQDGGDLNNYDIDNTPSDEIRQEAINSIIELVRSDVA